MHENALPLTPSGTRPAAAGMVRTAVPTTPWTAPLASPLLLRYGYPVATRPE